MIYENAEPQDASPIGPLVQTVFTSIVEVSLICLFGYFIASRGILDKNFQRLNRLNVSLFTPSPLFSKVVFFLTPEKLKELWIIPILFVLVTIVSMLISYILGRIFRLKKSHRSFAMAASVFMNANSLPIAMMQSLVVTVPGLKWSKDDSKDAMEGRAVAYCVLYSTFVMALRWSYGVRLLEEADEEAAPNDLEVNERTPLLSSSATNSPTNSRKTGLLRHISSLPKLNAEDRHSVLYKGVDHGLMPDVTVENPDRLQPRAVNVFASDDTRSFFRRSKHSISRVWKNLNAFMTPPAWASLASLFVASIRPLQEAIELYMHPVKGALTATGNCAIPITLIVLGAYFYQPPSASGEERPAEIGHTAESSTSSQPSGDTFTSMLTTAVRENRESVPNSEKRPGETKTVVIAILSRMVFTPMLILPMLILSTKFDLNVVFHDPVFIVAVVLLMSSAPALTLAQVTQAVSGDLERLISRTIFWAYCIVTPPATIFYVVIGIVLSKQ